MIQKLYGDNSNKSAPQVSKDLDVNSKKQLLNAIKRAGYKGKIESIK